MPPFIGCQCWYSFNDKTAFLGTKFILTFCVWADFFVFFFFLATLKECIPNLFDVLCSDKIQNCSENHASMKQSLGVTYEAITWASLQRDSKTKLFYYYCCWATQLCPALCDPMDCSMPGFPECLLILYTDNWSSCETSLCTKYYCVSEAIYMTCFCFFFFFFFFF